MQRCILGLNVLREEGWALVRFEGVSEDRVGSRKWSCDVLRSSCLQYPIRQLLDSVGAGKLVPRYRSDSGP
jgi:hypothetical protein